MKNAIVGNLVKWTFDDGIPALTLDCTKVSGANRAYATLYGLNVRVTRMAALARMDKDGNVRTITETMRHDAIAEGIAHYESDSTAWELRTSRVIPQNPVWLAMAEKRGVDYATIAAERAQADLDALAAM